MNDMMNRLKGMLSIPEDPPPDTTVFKPPPNLGQPNNGQPGIRTTATIIPTKISSYTPSSSYKPVPIRPEPVITSPESNLTAITNVTSKFLSENITKLDNISSKGISFIKTNLINPETSTAGTATTPNSVSQKRPTFVRQGTVSQPTTPKANSRISRAESLMKSSAKPQLKPTNSLPTRPTPTKSAPLNLDEYRIKLAQVRALDNVNKLSDVNSITSATYVTSGKDIIPNGTTSTVVTAAISGSCVTDSANSSSSTPTKSGPTTVVHSAAAAASRKPSFTGVAGTRTQLPIKTDQLALSTTTIPTNTIISTLSPTESKSTVSTKPIPAIQVATTPTQHSKCSLSLQTISPSTRPTFPIFTFSNTNLKGPALNSQLPKRPNCFLRSLSSIATPNGCDTPSPKSPLSQANYLCPKQSTKLDLSKLDLDLEISDTSFLNGPKDNVKPPVLTLSDIKLEVRIKSIEKILVSLMQKHPQMALRRASIIKIAKNGKL